MNVKVDCDGEGWSRIQVVVEILILMDGGGRKDTGGGGMKDTGGG